MAETRETCETCTWWKARRTTACDGCKCAKKAGMVAMGLFEQTYERIE